MGLGLGLGRDGMGWEVGFFCGKKKKEENEKERCATWGERKREKKKEGMVLRRDGRGERVAVSCGVE